jgi:outer membrane protein TolC
MPLVQWRAGKAAVEAARADQDRVETQTRLARANQEQEARFAALQVAQASRQLALAAKADTVGEKRFDIAKNRYIIGRIAISDLFIAQSEKDGARTASIQALRQYWLAYYRLRRLTLFDFATNAPLRPDA